MITFIISVVLLLLGYFLYSKLIEKILGAVKSVRVCLIGDLCLDAYWTADMKKSRLSRETPHVPLPVT